LFQTDNPVEEIKKIADYQKLFEAFGFQVAHVKNGHSCEEILSVWNSIRKQEQLWVIFLHTTKGGGSQFTLPQNNLQPWHGKIPSWSEYAKIIEEQIVSALADVEDLPVSSLVQEIKNLWEEFRGQVDYDHLPNPEKSTLLGVGKAFGKHVQTLIESNDRICVLDADLASSCGLSGPILKHPRFFELGISEQDMVSFAGGLALKGKIPIVNTYASFYKRALDQISVNSSEETKVIYAGHYAGLCYHTDGRSHQSLNDLVFMSAIPDLILLDPITPLHALQLLDASILDEHQTSFYFRLRRTPCPSLDFIDEHLQQTTNPFQPLLIRNPEVWDGKVLVTTGTLATQLALESCASSEKFSNSRIIVQSSFIRDSPKIKAGLYNSVVEKLEELLRDSKDIITIEDSVDPGVLFPLISKVIFNIKSDSIRVQPVTLSKFGFSFRTLTETLRYFEFEPTRVTELV